MIKVKKMNQKNLNNQSKIKNLKHFRCEETIEITATNAADIMCALGQYLSQLAHGGSNPAGATAKKVCFCLKYNEGI